MGSSKIGPKLSTAEILQLVQDDLQLVEKEIGLESVASVQAVTAISHYLQEGGGKRLRPILLLLSSRLVGDGGETAIRLAAVVELIHTATLVHDDVIDDAEIRRGRPSVNHLWGNHTSVLAGDWLYMQAFQVALRERNFHVLDLLIGLTQLMVEGELLQLESLGRSDVTQSDYMELVDRKTASLFSTCARLGALTARADESVEAKLGDFAWNLGMAFQLVDDILDFTAEESVLGKPVGSDLREGKVTLPLIYALESATPAERQAVEQVLADRSYERVSFQEIRAILDQYQGIERARERAQVFTERARNVISTFPETPYQRALQLITEIVTDRDH
jgi:octaprenyl-diphosphate synthase